MPSWPSQAAIAFLGLHVGCLGPQKSSSQSFQSPTLNRKTSTVPGRTQAMHPRSLNGAQVFGPEEQQDRCGARYEGRFGDLGSSALASTAKAGGVQCHVASLVSTLLDMPS